jgi:hypothetical protein
MSPWLSSALGPNGYTTHSPNEKLFAFRQPSAFFHARSVACAWSRCFLGSCVRSVSGRKAKWCFSCRCIDVVLPFRNASRCQSTAFWMGYGICYWHHCHRLRLVCLRCVFGPGDWTVSFGCHSRTSDHGITLLMVHPSGHQHLDTWTKQRTDLTKSLQRMRAGHLARQFEHHGPPASLSSVVRCDMKLRMSLLSMDSS